MELEDVHSELHALRKLYGLLQITEDGLHTSSVNLDERSRLLLKNLLDCATGRVFETHSKIIATQSGVCNKACSTQLEQPKATPKLQPPASLDILNACPIVIQNSSTDWNLHTVTSLKDDSLSTRSTHEGIVLVQSKPNISGTKPETRKKRCRVCEQSSTKLLNSARETKTFKEKTQSSNNGGKDQDQRHANRLSHVHKVNEHVKGLEPKKKAIESLNSTEKARQKRIHEIQRNASTVRSLASSSGTLVSGVIKPGGEHNRACEIDKKPEDVDYISTEVAKVIKRIETHLAAVQLPAEVVDSLKEKNALHQGLCMKANSIPIADTVGIELPSQVVSQKEGKTRDTNDMLSQLASQTDGKSKSKRTTSPDNVPNQVSKPNNAQHELLNQKPSQVPGQNVKAIVKKLESLSRLTSQNDHLSSQTHNYVHGLRVSPSKDELVKGPPLHVKMPSQIDKENRDHNPTAQKETRGKVGMSRDFVGHSGKSLAVNPSHKLSRTRARESTRRENNLPHQMILRPTLVDHESSQIINEDCREDRKRSGVHKSIHEGARNKILPRQQSSGESSSSSGASSWTTQQSSISSSESEGYPRPPRTATSRRLDRVASDGSSVQYSSSHGTGSQYWDVEPPPPRRTGHVKSYGLDSGVNSGKRIGRLRRLKNKLGLIFHHHHHHYHHHHEKDNDYGNNADLGHATSLSLWKHMGKIFHHRNNDKVYGDQAGDKTRKSVVNRVPRGNQRGHFGALVEGLMRHTRQSKKSKPSNGDIRRLEKSQHGYNRKSVKKLHWWQMIGQHHRGVKLPNVKLGFVSKKRQLR